jgi:hypothetical protein
VATPGGFLKEPMKTFLSISLALLSSLSQAQTIATLQGPFDCTDAGVCLVVPNDQNAQISVTLPNTIAPSLTVSVNGIATVYAPGQFSVAFNAVPRSFNAYPVYTFPGGRLSFYNHSARAGSYLHSTYCQSCVVWRLTGGTVSY